VRSTKDGSTYLDDGYWVTFGFSLSAELGLRGVAAVRRRPCRQRSPERC
jgi:hypothetical protein